MSEINLEEQVMSEIKSGRVKLRSKYIFLAEKLGIGSVLAFTILLAVLFFSLALFYLKSSDNLGYLSFGSRGILAFLESFPYLLVITFVVLIFIAGFIIKKSGFFYQRPFGYLAVALLGSIILLGLGLGLTNFNEKIEQGAFNRHPGGILFKPFLDQGLESRQRGLVGRIKEITSDFLLVQTPRETEKVLITHLEEPLPSLHPNIFIMVVGEKQADAFVARGIRIVEDRSMEMIKRGVRQRFDIQKLPPPQGFIIEPIIR
ncbi:MAG TPA: hypothetical protein PKY08_03190 [Candidatus Magasanikbacteria bacterium]|nr:hypothetical protein [Candidatus Magasanikbacteria bacterium]